ncbi:hypothetical protein ILUMI_00753, partial [Ignelater luminosus]
FFKRYYEEYLKNVLVGSRSKENSPKTIAPTAMAIDQKETLVTDSPRFHCQKCSKSYKNKRHLYRHEKEECIDVVPRFKCVLCLNMFRRKYHLVRHMNNKHGIDLK